MLRSTSEPLFARIGRIYGKPALLSGSLGYTFYVLLQIDQFHGSVSRTALNIVAGILPCALAGCLIAPAFVPSTSILTTRSRGARGFGVRAAKLTAVVGIVVALAEMLDYFGRAG